MVRNSVLNARRLPGMALVAACLIAAGCDSSDVGSVSAAKPGASSGSEPGAGPAAGAGKRTVDESKAPQREALPKAARRKG